MIQYAIIGTNGKTIAIASTLEVVEQYITDIANHKLYFARKKQLETARRENNRKHSMSQNVNHAKVASKELQSVKDIIRENPNLKQFLESEVARLTALVVEEKALITSKLQNHEAAKRAVELAWFNTLSDQDKMIWEGNWDHAKDGSTPSYKPVQFLG